MKRLKYNLDNGKKILYIGTNLNKIIEELYKNGFTVNDFATYTNKYHDYGPLTIAKKSSLEFIDLSVFDLVFIEHRRKDTVRYEIHEKSTEIKNDSPIN